MVAGNGKKETGLLNSHDFYETASGVLLRETGGILTQDERKDARALVGDPSRVIDLADDGPQIAVSELRHDESRKYNNRLGSAPRLEDSGLAEHHAQLTG